MGRRTGRWLRAIGVAAVLGGPVLVLARPAGAATAPTVPPAPVTAPAPATPTDPGVGATTTTLFDPSLFTVAPEARTATPKPGVSGGEIAFIVLLVIVGLVVAVVRYLGGWRTWTIFSRRPRPPWYSGGVYRKEPGERGRWF